MTPLEAFLTLATPDERAAIDAARRAGELGPLVLFMGGRPDPERDRLLELRWAAHRAFEAIAPRLVSAATAVTGISKITGREEDVPRRLLLRVDKIGWTASTVGPFTDIDVTLPPGEAPAIESDDSSEPERPATDKEIIAALRGVCARATRKGQPWPDRKKLAQLAHNRLSARGLSAKIRGRIEPLADREEFKANRRSRGNPYWSRP